MNQFQPARTDTNPLGVAGFVISIVGLCVGGLLSPVGLVLSLIALGKQPRGFAIAGTIIGAIGSCGIIIALVAIPVILALVLAMAGMTAAALGIAAFAGPQAEAQIEMFVIASNIEERIQQSSGTLPATIADGAPTLSEAQKTDPWKHPYVYEVTQEGKAFRLYSMGPDGLAATGDDVRYEWKIEINNQPSHVDDSPPPAVLAPPSEAPSSESPAEETGTETPPPAGS
jgi:hypothetical protein